MIVECCHLIGLIRLCWPINGSNERSPFFVGPVDPCLSEPLLPMVVMK